MLHLVESGILDLVSILYFTCLCFGNIISTKHGICEIGAHHKITRLPEGDYLPFCCYFAAAIGSFGKVSSVL